MRRTLEIISLATITFLAWITGSALYGTHRLPDTIPVHFNMAGVADGWGPPSTLLILPVITVAIYLLFTLLKKRLLDASSYPVEVTDENRARLEALYFDLLIWIKTEVVCLFAGIQWDSIASTRHHVPSIPLNAQIMASVVVLLVTVAWFNIAMRRAGLNP